MSFVGERFAPPNEGSDKASNKTIDPISGIHYWNNPLPLQGESRLSRFVQRWKVAL